MGERVLTNPETASAADFDMHDSELMQRPYTYYDRIRESGCPVGRSEQLGGFFFTTTYAGARRVYDDFRNFTSTDGTALPKQPLPLYPIDMDPPEQTRMRKLLNPLFLPGAIASYQPRMVEVINALIDGFIDRGQVELQEELVRPTLALIILPFLGVPMTDRAMLAHKLDYLTRRRADDPETCARYGEELGSYIMDFIAARRQAPKQDDIMQTLLDGEIGGRPLTDLEILGTVTLVLFGGLDTTSAALGLTLWHLIENPEVARRLLENEIPFDKALHEYVRYASPIQGLRRTVARDTELEGCPLRAGEFVMAMNGAANHDPDQFPEPNEIQFDRPITKEHDHLGFGGGAHICLGQHFAKTLMETLIRAVLTRLPDLRVEEGFAPQFAVGESRVLRHLPVRFTPVVNRLGASRAAAA